MVYSKIKKQLGLLPIDKNKLIALHNYLEIKKHTHFYYDKSSDLRNHGFNDITPLVITSFSAKGLSLKT
jgi:hypothetical protein